MSNIPSPSPKKRKNSAALFATRKATVITRIATAKAKIKNALHATLLTLDEQYFSIPLMARGLTFMNIQLATNLHHTLKSSLSPLVMTDDSVNIPFCWTQWRLPRQQYLHLSEAQYPISATLHLIKSTSL